MFPIFNLLLAACCMACTEVNPDYTPKESAEATSNFAKGADISWITQMESEGLKFYDAQGEQMECTALMKRIGMNSIRLRVWVDPVEGWNNMGDVLLKARRAHDLGMRLMIDFHYSDTWADPGSQTIPAAWAEYDIEQMVEALSAHTVEVLTLLKQNDIDVEWVQVGNETTDGMLWPLGRCSTEPENYAALTDAGYEAVKQVYPDAQVIVHLDGGQNKARYSWLFGELTAHGARFDMIGMSLYPGSDWRATTQECVENIVLMHQTYGCPVMICEVGMPWDDAATAKEMLTWLIRSSEATGCCDGVFYWEPEAPAGYNDGYMLGAFADGKPTEALDAFND